MENTTLKDFNDLTIALNEANSYGLEAEVILHAMYALQGNNMLTIGEALQRGLNEWIK